MLHLIPAVKELKTIGGELSNPSVYLAESNLDSRIETAVKKLPYCEDGIPLYVVFDNGMNSEEYELTVLADCIRVRSGSEAGAFYAVQTLRQIFDSGVVPCVYIHDFPDFPHRGFYHDVTRGKIPTVENVKQLIDLLAYYKINSLQLYVEHTYEFRECQKLHASTGKMTAAEMKEIGNYCHENFIDFIPSLSTFGHLYELLNQEEYRHLRIFREESPVLPNFWRARMRHHTIDPRQEESIELIRSLIEQYAPAFDSDYFNICCDETFDLSSCEEIEDPGKLYVEFVKKIISCVREKGKKVMMWADILLKYPEVITDLPEDTIFLNWKYQMDPPEEVIECFSKLERKQIVCPGTTTWNRFCENVLVEENNICKMAEYGKKHGAIGVLNTNWGDWGNPCSVELAMYGMVLGAEKAWSVKTQPDACFYDSVNALLYREKRGMEFLKRVSSLNSMIHWRDFAVCYFAHLAGRPSEAPSISAEGVRKIQETYLALKADLDSVAESEYISEMKIAAEGVCVLAELYGKFFDVPVKRVTDTEAWLERFSEKWLLKNQPSELCKIQEMFHYCENL